MKILTTLALCAFFAGPAIWAEDEPLVLDAATQARLGIETATLEDATVGGQVEAYARVIDPAPLVALVAEMDTVNVKRDLLTKEAARTVALAKEDSVSVREAEQAAAALEAVKLELGHLKQRLSLEWGGYFSGLDKATLHKLTAALAEEKAAFVRVDTASGAGLDRAKCATLDLGALGSAQATLVGISRSADIELQSPGAVGVVEGAKARYLSVGLALRASLPLGEGRTAILIPRESLLRDAGHLYAFVKVAADRFERRPVNPIGQADSGPLVQDGFAVGDQIVIQGGAALLTAAAPPESEDEEEDDQ